MGKSEGKAGKSFPKTPIGRVSFASVFKPTAMSDDQEKKYSVTLLFPEGTDLKEMKKLAEQTAVEKWGPKAKSMNLRSPFRDGGEKDHLDGYEEGITFIRFSGKNRPHVVDQQKNPIDPDSGEFYSGCYAHLTYTCYAYDQKGNRGVSFGLVNVQKVKDGEPFGAGQSDPDSDFDEVSDEDAEDLDEAMS